MCRCRIRRRKSLWMRRGVRLGPDLPKEAPPLQIAHQPEGGQ